MLPLILFRFEMARLGCYSYLRFRAPGSCFCRGKRPNGSCHFVKGAHEDSPSCSCCHFVSFISLDRDVAVIHGGGSLPRFVDSSFAAIASSGRAMRSIRYTTKTDPG